MSILSDYASAFDAHTREVISGAEQKPAEKKAPDRPLTALDYFGALFVRCRCSLSLSLLSPTRAAAHRPRAAPAENRVRVPLQRPAGRRLVLLDPLRGAPAALPPRPPRSALALPPADGSAAFAQVSIPAWKSVLEGWAWKKFSIWNNRTGGTGAVHKSTLLWRSARPARLPNPSRQRAQMLTPARVCVQRGHNTRGGGDAGAAATETNGARTLAFCWQFQRLTPAFLAAAHALQTAGRVFPAGGAGWRGPVHVRRGPSLHGVREGVVVLAREREEWNGWFVDILHFGRHAGLDQ